ncbi:MAG TPA: diacylglycerol kinase family protein [Terriglobales bacterium]|nr:diacylglycerol kinase family protein [Terriglobales bacterium]
MFLAIINPAAGGGRCRKLVGPALERLRAGGIELETIETHAPGEATRIAREAYARGQREFLAIGGDGTSYEVINGLYPDALAENVEGNIPTLGFLPLGTGNSFLRDFGDQGVEHAMEALLARRSQPCDVLRLMHREGTLHYINLLSVGFSADVNILRQRRFQNAGTLGYWVSIFLGLAQLKRRPFPVRVAGEGEFDRRPCLFLSFNNSKFTGGTMMIAPAAATDDGLIDFIRWGPIGRAGLVRNLGGLYDGTHVKHRLAESKKASRIEFDLDGPIDLMVDGEALTLHCEAIDVLPGALKVVV